MPETTTIETAQDARDAVRDGIDRDQPVAVSLDVLLFMFSDRDLDPNDVAALRAAVESFCAELHANLWATPHGSFEFRRCHLCPEDHKEGN